MSGVWELPFGRSKQYLSRGIVSQVLGNWQLNGVVQLPSGQPYNLAVAGDAANIGNTSFANYARPNIVGDPNPAHRTLNEWFNPNASAVPSSHTEILDETVCGRHPCTMRTSPCSKISRRVKDSSSLSGRNSLTLSTSKTTVHLATQLSVLPEPDRSPPTCFRTADPIWPAIWVFEANRFGPLWMG
jgi:hypothetical protein